MHTFNSLKANCKGQPCTLGGILIASGNNYSSRALTIYLQHERRRPTTMLYPILHLLVQNIFQLPVKLPCKEIFYESSYTNRLLIEHSK